MWKKIWISFVPALLFAQGIQVWFPDTTADAGDTVDLPIYVEDTSPYGGIWAAEIRLRFDPAVIRAIGAHTGSLTQGWLFVYQPDTVDGDSLRLAMASPFPDSGAGTLAGVIFHVVGSPGDSTVIEFDTVQLWNPDSELVVLPVDGSLRVRSVTVAEKLPEGSPRPDLRFDPASKLLAVIPGGSGPVDLRVVGVNGRVLVEKRLRSPARISLASLPSGVYLVQVWSGTVHFGRRLILIR